MENSGRVICLNRGHGFSLLIQILLIITGTGAQIVAPQYFIFTGDVSISQSAGHDRSQGGF